MKFKFKNVEIDYDVDECNSKQFLIENIFTPKKERGKGLARQALTSFLKFYDEKYSYNKLSLYVFPQEEGICKKRLISFYEEFGFVSNSEEPYIMMRECYNF